MNPMKAALVIVIAGLLSAGCASQGYNTQKGAAIGAGMGALYGQAIGRDTESTLIGTALGGLAGAVVGNYHDQRMQQQAAQGPNYESQWRSPQRTPRRSSYSGYAPASRGRWVVVPGQYVGGAYVPAHQVWVEGPEPVQVAR